MHKISVFTGSARHSWDKTIGFSSQRPPNDMPGNPPSTAKTRQDVASLPRQTAPRAQYLHLSFNVPFSSNLAGPEVGDIIHASPNAKERWTHLAGTPQGTPNYRLPIHMTNLDNLRALCMKMQDESEGKLQTATVTAFPRQVPGRAVRPQTGWVTNVCLSGEHELVQRMRSRILNNTPFSLKSANVDIKQDLISNLESELTQSIKSVVIDHVNYIAEYTGTDIFLLRPKQGDIESASFNGVLDNHFDQNLRLVIYGDIESLEHAKTRVLVMIDQILHHNVDVFKLEQSLHTMISGRLGRNIKIIESSTKTAIYFPPPFQQVYGYTPPGARRRCEDEILITGQTDHDIYKAKVRLHELVRSTTTCVKEVKVSPEKIDSILIERLDKIKRTIEVNGTYVVFPQLGVQRGIIRVQGTDMLHVERTIREIMTLSGEFYTASWWITLTDGAQRVPTAQEIKVMLADISISSGADVGFEKLTYHISGSDEAIKSALDIIQGLAFAQTSGAHLRVKIELANEHREFVSGKKNGKINKIMSQSNVQVYFDMFNEYNFFIDVSGASWEVTKNGLDLVEAEMPASIAFHVPDQYHKRIIGIGGQHIQRIMKKYSVFVKFSNAMDRGGTSKDDDDIKVDNVICRTPARNAQNLDLVKQEIMDMVEKADAEFVTEKVPLDRLLHRKLLHRLSEIEELEKDTNCKITFPSTEQASDFVTVMGPQYQVLKAIDGFLHMVPETHEISLSTTAEMVEYFTTKEFQMDVVEKLKSQYEMDLHVHGQSSASSGHEAQTERLTLSYTRNNVGGLKDAIDFVTTQLVPFGLDADTVRGAIPRPKSDSFEDSLPFFDSKLLHRAEPPMPTDSPTHSVDGHERSFFRKIRKPGSITSLSSFLDRRKNGSSSSGSFMKHASSNASKASLASLESQGSGYHNPWNDSGINLPVDDDGWPQRFTSGADNKFSPGPVAGASASTSNLVSTSLPPPGSSHSNTAPMLPGDVTPKNDLLGNGRLSPSQPVSFDGGPGPIAPPSQ